MENLFDEMRLCLEKLNDALEISMGCENENKEFIKISEKIYNAFKALEKLQFKIQKGE